VWARTLPRMHGTAGSERSAVGLVLAPSAASGMGCRRSDPHLPLPGSGFAGFVGGGEVAAQLTGAEAGQGGAGRLAGACVRRAFQCGQPVPQPLMVLADHILGMAGRVGSVSLIPDPRRPA
jgi:hypothetical protein